eukprot:jgi/Bigna1/63106/fgenesh1_kg.47_\
MAQNGQGSRLGKVISNVQRCHRDDHCDESGSRDWILRKYDFLLAPVIVVPSSSSHVQAILASMCVNAECSTSHLI